MNSSSNECSTTFNTTESGMWENERKVCENAAAASALIDDNGGGTPIEMNLSCNFNARGYLPQFIVRRFGDACPIAADSCLLNTKFDGKTDELHHRYTVSWIEDGPIHQEIDRMSLLTEKTKSAKKKKKNTRNINNNNNMMMMEKNNSNNAPENGDCKNAATMNVTAAAAPNEDAAAVFATPLPLVEKCTSEILHSEHSSTSLDKEINVELGGKHPYQPEVRKCDGPCAAMRAVNDLLILGRCDHAICTFCVVNAPMVPREDGSMGCCNKKCFACDLVNQITDQNRRHDYYQQIFRNQKFEEIFKLYKGDIRRAKMPRHDLSQTSVVSKSPARAITNATSASSFCDTEVSVASSSSGKYDLPPGYSTTTSTATSTSASTSASATDSSEKSAKSTATNSSSASFGALQKGGGVSEIMLFRLVILESSYFSTIKRHRFEQEIDSRMALLAAVEMLMGISAGRNLFNSTTRIFFCPTEKTEPEAMLEMNAKEHGTLSMRELAAGRGMINIVIDYTGKLIKEKRQPFKLAIKSKKMKKK